MKMRTTALLIILAVALSGCVHRVVEHSHEACPHLEQLRGKNCVLSVERLARHPAVRTPGSALQEDEYRKLDGIIEYKVRFSGDGQTVTIEGGENGTEVLVSRAKPLVLKKVPDADQPGLYHPANPSLDFMGQFRVWVKGQGFEAELTRYGSGVPVIASGRGPLTLKD